MWHNVRSYNMIPCALRYCRFLIGNGRTWRRRKWLERKPIRRLAHSLCIAHLAVVICNVLFCLCSVIYFANDIDTYFSHTHTHTGVRGDTHRRIYCMAFGSCFFRATFCSFTSFHMQMSVWRRSMIASAAVSWTMVFVVAEQLLWLAIWSHLGTIKSPLVS